VLASDVLGIQDPSMSGASNKSNEWMCQFLLFIFLLARERVELKKSCNLIGSWSRQNFLIWTATAGGIRQVDLFW